MDRRVKTSRYRGVSVERPGSYRVRVGHRGHKFSLGTFPTEQAAALAFDAFWRARGRTTDLNFPTEAERAAARAEAEAGASRAPAPGKTYHGLDKADDAAIQTAIALIRAEKERRGEAYVNPPPPARVPLVRYPDRLRDSSRTGRAEW